jgi:glucan phosphorylase
MLLADYQSYADCQEQVSEAYRDRDKWTADVDSQLGSYGQILSAIAQSGNIVKRFGKLIRSRLV